MNIGISIPMGLQKILNTVQAMDNDSQERILQSASIFAYGRISGRKADYAEGFAAGYARAKAEAERNTD